MINKIQAVILAGGKGTRLAPLTDNLPKPLVPVANKAMILYVLEHLRRSNITNVSVATAHLGHMIEDLLGDGSSIGMQISYLREPEPMGTGGWTQLVDWDQLDDHFLVLNSDNLFWIDIDAFLNRHKETGASATIAAIEIPADKHGAYEILLPGTDGTTLLRYVDRSDSKPFLEASDNIFVSSGWYVMTPAIKDLIPAKNPISNETDVWPLIDKSDHDVGFYHATEPWFDSGTHERLARVAEFIQKNPDL
ncbi:MAG: NDP-sugar synthase [Candidatus Uhrbacteria bacterium]|nr:NDP-sugar synthase [Candidatus Uhrbacteria bacterium]